MKIYIQSKSGDYNAELEIAEFTLELALARLRKRGGYTAEYREESVFVPFEEIQSVGAAKPDGTER